MAYKIYKSCCYCFFLFVKCCFIQFYPCHEYRICPQRTCDKDRQNENESGQELASHPPLFIFSFIHSSKCIMATILCPFLPLAETVLGLCSHACIQVVYIGHCILLRVYFKWNIKYNATPF